MCVNCETHRAKHLRALKCAHEDAINSLASEWATASDGNVNSVFLLSVSFSTYTLSCPSSTVGFSFFFPVTCVFRCLLRAILTRSEWMRLQQQHQDRIHFDPLFRSLIWSIWWNWFFYETMYAGIVTSCIIRLNKSIFYTSLLRQDTDEFTDITVAHFVQQFYINSSVADAQKSRMCSTVCKL